MADNGSYTVIVDYADYAKNREIQEPIGRNIKNRQFKVGKIFDGTKEANAEPSRQASNSAFTRSEGQYVEAGSDNQDSEKDK